MEKFYLNRTLSKEVYDAGNYVPKHCYDNVFNNIGSVGFKFKEEDIKVMFCYISVGNLEGLYTRHACYFLDGMAVDPTIISVYGEDIDKYEITYIPIRVVSVNEYFILLSRERRTDLFKTFSTVEKMKHKELKDNGITLIG